MFFFLSRLQEDVYLHKIEHRSHPSHKYIILRPNSHFRMKVENPWNIHGSANYIIGMTTETKRSCDDTRRFTADKGTDHHDHHTCPMDRQKHCSHRPRLTHRNSEAYPRIRSDLGVSAYRDLFAWTSISICGDLRPSSWSLSACPCSWCMANNCQWILLSLYSNADSQNGGYWIERRES